jgi:D-glycero-D-manno-heptose 1,7-bisphosphate phosphatase
MSADNPLLILDRDGVINEDSDAYIKSAEEWRPIPGSIEAIARLCRAGYTVAVASNQSGIGRGLFDQRTLRAMEEKCLALVRAAGGDIAGFYYCPHHPEIGCDCRKPRPGLLDAIQRELGLELAGAFAVGDSLRDLQAARARHCRPILVRTGKGERTLRQIREEDERGWETLPVFDNLADFTQHLLTGKLSG